MNKIFNEQFELLQQDLQEISNPYERAHIRVLLLGTLSGLTEEPPIDMPTGKDAIKNDIVKEPIAFDEVPTQEVETPEEEM